MDLDVNALQMLADEEQAGLTDCEWTCPLTNGHITVDTPWGSSTW
ncbi:ALQxL family class IV lanthipeptide [Streptomyces griseochromogenes]